MQPVAMKREVCLGVDHYYYPEEHFASDGLLRW